MTDNLRDMLQNVMGPIDTPIARRRLGIGVDQPEWLTEARAALAAAPQPAPTHECPVCEETVTWTRPGSPYCGECAADNGRDVRMRSIGTAPQPAPVDREALVGAIADRATLAREIAKAMIGRAPGNGMILAIADALLARGLRLPGDETMAWAVLGEDGKMVAINYDRMTAQHLCNPGERVVRVAIRVVEGGDDAA